MSHYDYTKSRIVQWIGIILIIGLFAGAYWYFRVRASTLNAPQNDSLSSGLVGLWSFNGDDISGTTAYDRSVSGYNATLTGSNSAIVGKVGQARSFSGGGARVNAITQTGKTYTFAMWVNLSNANGYLFDTGLGRLVLDFGQNATARAMSYYDGTWKSIGSTNSIPLNEWVHLVWVLDNGTSTATAYMNGALVGTNTYTGVNISTQSCIGDFNDCVGSAAPMAGSLDEVRLYNRVLSASEIQSLYAQGGGTKVDTSVSQAQGTGRLDSGLAGYWPLDDGSGTSAIDSSTNGNTGTLTNGPTWTTGQIGGAVDFDGTNDYISVGSGGAVNDFTSSDFTFSQWIKLSSLTTNVGGQGPVLLYKGAYQVNGYYAQVALDGSVSFITNQAGAAQGSSTASGTISAGTWYHLVYARKGASVRIYVNGVDATSSAGSHINPTSSASNFFMGLYNASGIYMNGQMDEVRVYDRTLSADEVSQLYRLTSPTSVDTSLKGYWSFNGKDLSGTTAYDRSGAGNNGTLTNGPTSINGQVGQGLSFDGTNDQVVVTDANSLDITGAIALSTWIKTSDTNSCIIAKSTEPTGKCFGTVGNKVYELGILSGTLWFQFGNGVTTSFVSGSAAGITDNQWHNVVATWDGTTGTNGIKVYIDGVVTYQGTASAATIQSTTSDLFFSAPSSYYYSGLIDEVRLYSRNLLASEVRSLYDAGAGDKMNSSVSQNQGTGRLDSGLAGYWPLDDGSGTSATDSSGNNNTLTLTNGPTWSTGQIGGALSSDGSNDYAAVASMSNLPTTAVTVSAWVKAGSLKDWNNIVGHDWTSSGSWLLFITASGNALFGIYDTSQHTALISGLTTGVWYHLVGTYDGTNVRIYVNGVSSSPVALSNVALDTSGQLIISGINATSSFDGLIDDARVYNRALSADEVAQLYRLTSPTGVDTSLKGYWSFNGKDLSGTTAYDRSGSGKNGTLTSGPVPINGKIGQGLSFDGSNDYVDVPYANLDFERTDTFSVSAWAKFNDVAPAGGVQSILGRFSGTKGSLFGRCKNALITCNANSLQVSLVNNGLSNVIDVSTPTGSFLPNVWTHVTVTYDGSSSAGGVKVYKNGVNQTLTTFYNNLAASIKPNVNWRIGDDYTSDYAKGTIDEVRIYNRVLSASEVSSLYNAGQ